MELVPGQLVQVEAVAGQWQAALDLAKYRALAANGVFFAPRVGCVFAHTYIMSACHFDTFHLNARTNA